VLLDYAEECRGGEKSAGLKKVPKALYHAFAGLLGGEDYEWMTWPARILRLGVLFFCLIINSTYTANLASFFTKQGFTIHGPKGMALQPQPYWKP
jgi:hypothetical protein